MWGRDRYAGPFFPQEAESKGMSETTVGMVFTFFSLAGFCGSFVFGHYSGKLGLRRMLAFGVVMDAIFAVSFGFTDRLPSGTPFSAACFAIRIVQGASASAASVASFELAARAFPDYLSTALGIMEVFTAGGLCVGPALGGALFDAGGYQLPFIVLGSVTLAQLPLLLWLLPSDQARRDDAAQASSKKKAEATQLQMIKVPGVLVGLGANVIGMSAFACLEPTLSPQFKTVYHVGPSLMGGLFAMLAGTYGLVSFFAGAVADRAGTKIVMVVGLLSLGVAFHLLGPGPLIADAVSAVSAKLWYGCVVLVFLGLSAGTSFVPVMSDVMEAYPDKTVDVNAPASALLNSSFYAGSVIGPSLGAYWVKSLGFGPGMAVFSYMIFGWGVLTLAYALYTRTLFKAGGCCGRCCACCSAQAVGGDVVPDDDLDDDERTPLIRDNRIGAVN